MLTKIEQYAIDRVRDRRNQLGLTQDDLAIKSGYSSGFYCRSRQKREKI